MSDKQYKESLMSDKQYKESLMSNKQYKESLISDKQYKESLMSDIDEVEKLARSASVWVIIQQFDSGASEDQMVVSNIELGALPQAPLTPKDLLTSQPVGTAVNSYSGRPAWTPVAFSLPRVRRKSPQPA
eukprot:gene7303-420_t